MDINFTLLTGTVISVPSWIPLANNKRALIFTLMNLESYKYADGSKGSHKNPITIEVLGKNAEKAHSELTLNTKCQIVGYLRVDVLNGEEKMRVRAFRIERMEDGD